jgi:hypothetical protein
MLTKRSEYFSAMLSGRFVENASPNDTIQLKDVSYELFATIVELLEFDLESKSDVNNSLGSICFSSKLTFENCAELVMLCDRFFLHELKEFFISTLMYKFLTLSNWSECFKLAWFLNNQYIANVCIDFLLAQIMKFPISKEKYPSIVVQFKHVFQNLLINLRNLRDLNSSNSSQFSSKIMCENANELSEMLKKCFKMALSEIIRNNKWKF